MKQLASILLMTLLCIQAVATSAPVEENWKKTISQFAAEKLKHSAWGFSHFQRDYELAQTLATQDGVKLDTDVLFAAAFLHDLGAFDEFKKEGVDHAIRSVELVEKILLESGFPPTKIPRVKDAILGHMYYAKVSNAPEAVYLHDADTLDFLGEIGIVRITSVTGRHRWAPDLSGAVKTLEGFQQELPAKLITPAAKKLGKERADEMRTSLERLKAQSDNGKLL